MQPLSPGGIGLLLMLAAIDLDDQAMLKADKVREVRIDGLLSSKFDMPELAIA